MYWRTDFALELAQCNDHSAEWNAHADKWTLKSDNGPPLSKAYIDYSNPDAAAFFAKVLLDTLADGTLDYVYCDGAGTTFGTHFDGVSPQRTLAIMTAKHHIFTSVQAQLDAMGQGQKHCLERLR